MAEHCIETVLGPVRAGELGIVLPHEHVPLRLGPTSDEDLLEPPEGCRARLERLERAALREALACGARTLVEATPIGCCRSIPMMQRLSRDTGMHIVACTGFYLEDRFPASMQHLGEDEMAELFVRELVEGIAGTGVRPWMIKVAGLPELRPLEQRAFRAAAIASRQTGAAITTHSSGANRAHFDALVEMGADPTRIYLGHADFGADNAEHLHVAREGGHLIFTCWGIQQFIDQLVLANRIVELVEAGYASSVLLSIDYAIGFAASGIELIDYQYECTDRSHAYLFHYVLPRLRERGISEELIHQFLVDNPREMLIRPQDETIPADPVRLTVRSGLEVKTFSMETADDAVAVVNACLAGWPYTRPLDAGLLAYWQTLPAFQPEHLLIAYRDGCPRAFLHGEAGKDGAWTIHLLASLPGAVEEAAFLLRQFEEEARSAGATRLVSGHWRSKQFYGGYVLGLEPYHPHWAVDGTQAYVRAGFHTSLAGVIMVRDLVDALPVEAAPAGYRIVPAAAPAEFSARPFGYEAFAGEQPVARCYARLYPDLLAAHDRPIGQIGDVWTGEAHRSKGLARVMSQMCLRDLQRMGASQCLVATSLENCPALNAYENAGFQRRHSITEWSKELT